DQANRALGSGSEVSLRVQMGIDEIEIAVLRKPRQRVTRQCPQPIAVDGHEAAERQALSGTQHELRLHGFQKIKLNQPLAECPRRLELRLVGLQEIENVLQILRPLAFGIEQPFAKSPPVHAREGSV